MSEIALMRQGTGLSQAKFAERFNIPTRTLQQWEQERSNPPAYVVSMIRNLLSLEEQKAKVVTHTIPERTTWKVCISRPFPNCERIYPIQQRKVRAILDAVAGLEEVRCVIVFGSSVTQACHVGSDVDVYLELSGDVSLPLSNLGFDVDVWNNFTVDERLMREIKRKGVVVYG